MTRYSDPFVCPDCSARLPIDVTGCPSCGLLLSGPLATELLQTLQAADGLLVRLRAASTSPAEVAHAAPYPVSAPLPRQHDRRGISALSVPKILLGLGAFCLLVAALIFLAVAWSWLGVGGRTAVLVALTLLTGALAVELERRGLRVAAESLSVVSLGLLALDVVGADNAGWLGDLSPVGLVSVVGAAVLLAALGLAFSTRLEAPQVLAALALSTLGLGLVGTTEHVTAVVVVVVLAHAVLVAAGGLRQLRALPVVAGVGASSWWLGLAIDGLDDATAHPSLHGLWTEGHGVALVAAALVLLLPVPFVRGQTAVSGSLAAVATGILVVAACLPAVDESVTTLALVSLVALAALTAASIVTPTIWKPVPWLSMLVVGTPVLGITLALAVQAAVNAAGSHPSFTQDAGVRLADPDALAAPALLLVGVAVLAAAVLSCLPRPVDRAWLAGSAVVLALTAIGTLALLTVPAWTVAGALALLGAGLVGDALRRTTSYGVGEALTGVAIAGAAVIVALPSDVLTTIATGVLVVLAAAVLWGGRFAEARIAGGLLLPVTTAGFLWCVLEASGVQLDHRAVPIIVVLGLMAIAIPRDEVETSAAAAALTVTALAVDSPSSLAVHLTVAGVLVSASALIHPRRRFLGWPGGLLLVAATWVRLGDIGVVAPEPYTLPSAVALLVVGLQRLRLDHTSTTARALVPGLLLATVPSLLWVLVEPVSLRATLLGVGCLGLVLAGAFLRWNAPLMVGAVAGVLVVLRELAPYALQTPQWVLIGIAGTLLTVVGVTWESRMRDVRHAASYLDRLR